MSSSQETYIESEDGISRRMSISALLNPSEQGGQSRMDLDDDDDDETLATIEGIQRRITDINSLHWRITLHQIANNRNLRTNLSVVAGSSRTPSRHNSPSWDRGETQNSATATSRRPKGVRCNKPYRQEELDWIKYHRQDCVEENGKPWYSWDKLVPMFEKDFPNGIRRLTRESLNSRWYRCTWYPNYDEHDNIVLVNNKPKMTKILKKDKASPAAVRLRRLGYLSFIRENPTRALQYPWVLEEHKDIAMSEVEQRVARGVPMDLPFADGKPPFYEDEEDEQEEEEL